MKTERQGSGSPLVGTLEKDHRGAAPKGNRGPWLGFLLTAILFLLPATSARAQMVTATVAAGAEARAAAVNPVANMIYAANSDSNTVTVIDGATNSTSTVTTGSNTLWVSVNPVTNKIYADNYDSNTVTVIDGATNSTSTVSAVNNPQWAAVNPVTNVIYVVGGGGGDIVTVLTEQQVQDIPLNTTITPLAGNQTASSTPTFSLTAASTFSPTAPPVENVFYQVDTWQGQWLAATNNGSGDFSAATPALQQGFHILYAYATDGQEATSTNTSHQGSPLIGNITAYGFLVVLQ